MQAKNRSTPLESFSLPIKLKINFTYIKAEKNAPDFTHVENVFSSGFVLVTKFLTAVITSRWKRLFFFGSGYKVTQ